MDTHSPRKNTRNIIAGAPVEVPVELSGFSARFSLSDGFSSTYSGFWLF